MESMLSNYQIFFLTVFLGFAFLLIDVNPLSHPRYRIRAVHSVFKDITVNIFQNGEIGLSFLSEDVENILSDLLDEYEDLYPRLAAASFVQAFFLIYRVKKLEIAVLRARERVIEDFRAYNDVTQVCVESAHTVVTPAHVVYLPTQAAIPPGMNRGH
ncbi:hypothetical protein OF83DRAFT_1170114 [Amylostereum chailletii]|nr:hypothetical protein OF83DRAFT_1170114 [Amylostereum chailletii]